MGAWAQDAYWGAAALFVAGAATFPNEQAWVAAAAVIAAAGVFDRQVDEGRSRRVVAVQRAVVVGSLVPLAFVGWGAGVLLGLAGVGVTVAISRWATSSQAGFGKVPRAGSQS